MSAAAPPNATEQSETQTFQSSIAKFMSGLGQIESPYQVEVPGSPTGSPPAAPVTPDKPDEKQPEQPKQPADKTAPAPEKPVEPAKPADAKTADAPAKQDDDTARPRTQEDWDKFKAKHGKIETDLRNDLKTRDTTIAELQAQLKQLQETSKSAPAEDPAAKAALEELKKQNEELSTRLQAIAVTEHPKFKAYFDGKVNAEIARAKQIAGPDVAEAIERALKMPDDPAWAVIKNNAIEEVLSNLTPLQQSRIGGVMNNLSAIADERSSEIARANENAAKMRASESAAQAEQSKKVNSAFESVAKQVQDSKDGLAIYQKRADNPDWNRQVDARIQHARALVTGKDANGNPIQMETIMRAAIEAAAFPAILQAYKADMAEHVATINKLNEQVKALTAAQPTAGRAGQATPSGDAPTPQPAIRSSMSPMEASAAWAKSFSEGMNQ